MNTHKIKKSLTVIWLVLALSFGTGLVSAQLGLANFGTTSVYACGAGHGGGC